MKKRIFSMLTALALYLTLLSISALAAGETTYLWRNTDDSRIYYDTTAPTTPASSATSSNELTVSGDYYTLDGATATTYKLMSDVTISKPILVTGTVTLDLNGYVLQTNGTNSVIRVGDGTNAASLTLTDSNTSAPTHYFDVDPTTGLWSLCTIPSCTTTHETVRGGIITGGNASSSQGGGVFVYTGSTFTMSGGNIVGCTAAKGGGGVYLYGRSSGSGATTTFTMSGGSIQGCTATGNGGGVYIENIGTEFTMSGDGTLIAHCTAHNGGGVSVEGGNRFTMENGAIRNCTAKGGGRNNGSGGGVQIGGSFIMSGGKITGCEATGSNSGLAALGGGVFVDSNACTLQGGTIEDNSATGTGINGPNGGGVFVNYGKILAVGGGSTALKIINNTRGTPTTPDNIFLNTSAKITAASGGLATGSSISLTLSSTSDLDLSSVANIDIGTLATDGYEWKGTATPKTLTLNGKTLHNITLPNANTTIIIQGNVTVNKIIGGASVTTIQKAESAASGTLTATEGIYTAGNLTLDGITVTANGISSTQYYGIYACGSVAVQNGADVTAVSGANCTTSCRLGLYVGNGLSVSGTGTKLTASGGNVAGSDETESYGIYLHEGDVTISNGAEVKAIGGNATVNTTSAEKNAYSYGLYTPGALNIGGKLTASAGKAETNANVAPANAGKAGGGSGAFSIGVYAGGGMTITAGAEVEATGGQTVSDGAAGGAYSYGVYANGTAVTVSGGKLTANSDSAEATKDNFSEAYSIGMFNSDSTTASGGTISLTGGAPTCSATVGGAYSYGIYTENLTVNKSAADIDFTATASNSGNGAAIYVKSAGALTLGKTIAVETPVGGAVGTATVRVETSDETYRTIATGSIAARSVTLKVAAPQINTPSGGSSTYTITVSKTDNGSVSVRPERAKKGATVTITVTQDTGYTLETLTVLDKNGNEIELTDNGDGTYSFKMPASKVEVKATFMEDNSMLNFFTDVSADKYYYNAVLWAAKNGITGGVDAVHFAPDAACTRAQAMTFLWRAAGSPEPKAVSSFSDVSADSYYAKAVAWAVENGITGGIDGNRFAPDATCTRAQAVTFLYRAAGSPAVSSSATFSDVDTDAYYTNAVAWAAKEGITDGIGGGLFGSDSECTRAQIVTFLYRSMK